MIDPLRYPIGDFVRQDAYTSAERQVIVARLAALPASLSAAISGLSHADFESPYRPGGWTVRQLVHHVADSHANAMIRLKLALTETNPTIKPYDQDAWAELGDVQDVSPLVSIAILAGIHERMSAVIQHMREEDFARGLVHPDSGPMSVDQLLALYAWHGDHHVAQVRALRMRAK